MARYSAIRFQEQQEDTLTINSDQLCIDFLMADIKDWLSGGNCLDGAKQSVKGLFSNFGYKPFQLANELDVKLVDIREIIF